MVDGGRDITKEQIYENSDKKSKRKLKAKEEQRLSQVSMGNLIKPNFSADGELMGFELRHELIPLYHLNNGRESVNLRRVVRVCMYMNRLLLDGKNSNFMLSESRADELEMVADKMDAEVQVDTEALKALSG